MSERLEDLIPENLRSWFAKEPGLNHLYLSYAMEVSGLVALARALVDAYKLGHNAGLTEAAKGGDG